MAVLINFEGLDYSGKSTLIKALQDSGKFPNAVYSKEPGSPVIPENVKLRDIILNTESLTPVQRELLFYADAMGHKNLIANLGSKVIFSDRGLWSHKAYVRGYLKSGQIDYDQYDACKKVLNLACAEPDAVIYIRSDLDTMRKRKFSRGNYQDAIERQPASFFEAVLDTYEDLVLGAEYAGDRCLVLNCDDPIDKNLQIVLNWLDEQFKPEQLESAH